MWDGCTSNQLHSVKPFLGYCNLTHLNRRAAVILRRLRIGHTRLTHQYLLRREEPPQCPSCNCALTVVHIILECQQYNSVRQKYFSVTTLRELPVFETVSADNILSFLRDIYLCSSVYRSFFCIVAHLFCFIHLLWISDSQSATTCHVRTLYVCFPRSPQGVTSSGVRSDNFHHNICGACAVTVVIFRCWNCLFYSLTYLLSTVSLKPCVWCVVGVTDSNAVRVQTAVPGTDVHEHCTTYDGHLGHDIACISRHLWRGYL